jgi:hypothetical protein
VRYQPRCSSAIGRLPARHALDVIPKTLLTNESFAPWFGVFDEAPAQASEPLLVTAMDPYLDPYGFCFFRLMRLFGVVSELG